MTRGNRPNSEKTKVCGEQLTEVAVTQEITHRCVKTFDVGTTDHKDGSVVHRCYCGKNYLSKEK